MAERIPTTARPQHCTTITQILAGAFRDDPVMSWLLPDEQRRPAALTSFFEFETRRVALRHTSSLLSTPAGDTGRIGGAGGAAIILPPGHWKTSLGTQLRHGIALTGVFRQRLPHAFALQTLLERTHPREPHYYLPFIGVATSARGQGIGGQLLTVLGERCDREQHPAYLEATSPDNARLYRRHGFVPLDQVRLWDSPPIERMLRPPRPT